MNKYYRTFIYGLLKRQVDFQMFCKYKEERQEILRQSMKTKKEHCVLLLKNIYDYYLNFYLSENEMALVQVR